MAACAATKPNQRQPAVAPAAACSTSPDNSYRLGEKVPFNLKAGKFGDNKDAYEHFAKLHEVMSDGVGVPEDGSEYVVGPWLTFDPATETHTGEFAAEANALLKDPNRPGFEVPTVADV